MPFSSWLSVDLYHLHKSMASESVDNSSGASGATSPPIQQQILSPYIPLPPKLDLRGNLASNWKKFKRLWVNYEIATRLNTKSKQLCVATLITCLGPDILDIYDGLPFTTEEEREDIDVVLKLLEDYGVGETNGMCSINATNKVSHLILT